MQAKIAAILISIFPIILFAESINEKIPGSDDIFLSLARVELRVYAAIFGVGGAILGFLVIRLLNQIEKRIAELEGKMSVSEIQNSRIAERFSHIPTREEVLKLVWEMKEK